MNICLVNICEYRRNSILCSVNCSVIINNKNFQKNFTRVKLIFGLGSTHIHTHPLRSFLFQLRYHFRFETVGIHLQPLCVRRWNFRVIGVVPRRNFAETFNQHSHQPPLLPLLAPPLPARQHERTCSRNNLWIKFLPTHLSLRVKRGCASSSSFYRFIPAN